MRAIALGTLGILAAVAAPRAQTAPQNPAVGAVSGAVTDATTHQPVEGVNIQLGPPPGQSGGRLGNTLTDGRGRFVFTGLTAGTYFINAVKAGYEDGHYGPGVNGALGGNLVLTAGQWVADANIQIVKLAALMGRVLNERGDPIASVPVRAITRLPVGGAPHLVVGPVATTNGQGEYRIEGLRPGAYAVMVPSVQQSVPATMGEADIEGVPADRLAALDAQAARPGGAAPARRSGGELVDGLTALIVGNYATPPPSVNGQRRAYPIKFFPDASTITAAMFTDLGPGDERFGLDITLRPVAAVRVSGHLDGQTGAMTAGMVLRMIAPDLEDLGEGSEVATAAVGPDGTFTFLNVPTGSYALLAPGSTFEFSLRAAAVGLQNRALPNTPGLGGRGNTGGLVSGAPGLGYNAHQPNTIGDAHAGFARLPLTVGPNDLAGLVVPLSPTGALHGRIVQDDVTTPFSVALADLTPADGSPALGAYICPTTAPARDSFECSLVLPGDYVVRLPNQTIKAITANGEDVSRHPISVGSGQDVQVLVTITGKPAAISGTVRDGHGRPVALGSAIAFPTDEILWSHYGFVPQWIRPSVGSNSGHFQITNVRAGEYYVVGVDAAHINAWADPAFLRTAIPFATKVTLAWGDSRTMDVPLMVAPGGRP